MCRRIIALTLVCALAAADGPAFAAGAGRGADAGIGVVTLAVDAHVGTAALSAGATLYEGDAISTEATGGLHARSGNALLYLPGKSCATLRRANDSANVRLDSGTIVFSVLKSSAVDIEALGAHMRPAADGASSAQISIVGPKLLEIHAKRGALQLSYNDESEVIAEGSSIRVMLDPSDGALAAADASANPPYPGQGPRKPGRKRRGLLFLLWGGTGAIATIVTIKALESPDRP
jgi:hypothetical protein